MKALLCTEIIICYDTFANTEDIGDSYHCQYTGSQYSYIAVTIILENQLQKGADYDNCAMYIILLYM